MGIMFVSWGWHWGVCAPGLRVNGLDVAALPPPAALRRLREEERNAVAPRRPLPTFVLRAARRSSGNQPATDASSDNVKAATATTRAKRSTEATGKKAATTRRTKKSVATDADDESQSGADTQPAAKVLSESESEVVPKTTRAKRSATKKPRAVRKASAAPVAAEIVTSGPESEEDEEFLNFLSRKAELKKAGMLDEDDEESLLAGLDELDERDGIVPASPEAESAPKNPGRARSGKASRPPAAVSASVEPVKKRNGQRVDDAGFDQYFGDGLDFAPSSRAGRVMPSTPHDMDEIDELFADHDEEIDDPLESAQILDEDSFSPQGAKGGAETFSSRRSANAPVDDEGLSDEGDSQGMNIEALLDGELEDDNDIVGEDDLDDDSMGPIHRRVKQRASEVSLSESDEDDDRFGIGAYFEDDNEDEEELDDVEDEDELGDESDLDIGAELDDEDDDIAEDEDAESTGRSRNLSSYAYVDNELDEDEGGEDGLEDDIDRDEDDDRDVSVDEDEEEDDDEAPVVSVSSRQRQKAESGSKMLRGAIEQNLHEMADLLDEAAAPAVPDLEKYNEFDSYEENMADDQDQLRIHSAVGETWEMNEDMYVTVVQAQDVTVRPDESRSDAQNDAELLAALLAQNPSVPTKGSPQWLASKMYELSFFTDYREKIRWCDRKQAPPQAVQDLFPGATLPAPPKLGRTVLFSDVRADDERAAAEKRSLVFTGNEYSDDEVYEQDTEDEDQVLLGDEEDEDEYVSSASNAHAESDSQIDEDYSGDEGREGEDGDFDDEDEEEYFDLEEIEEDLEVQQRTARRR
ncbi:hypothetical protein FVE85_2335 [Porphyridium purpureum]|uniref:Uncharacterized protein n=1 Tax=Porphyridium purpureum TaxID=35688 RepID=A0A5J4YYX0_PORPP|nr:hypothetical protein FVE85_2335 [Porphyridium purpureum]|eukprot:POR0901..scf209_3